MSAATTTRNRTDHGQIHRQQECFDAYILYINSELKHDFLFGKIKPLTDLDGRICPIYSP